MLIKKSKEIEIDNNILNNTYNNLKFSIIRNLFLKNNKLFYLLL